MEKRPFRRIRMSMKKSSIYILLYNGSTGNLHTTEDANKVDTKILYNTLI